MNNFELQNKFSIYYKYIPLINYNRNKKQYYNLDILQKYKLKYWDENGA